MRMPKPKFECKNIFQTNAIAIDFKDDMDILHECISRHFQNESDSSKQDIESNALAIKNKEGRVFSKFDTPKGTIFIVTGDLYYSDSNDINYYNTTIMYSNEY